MNFLYPSFLFALFALSIPIIIHLFHFRRFRKVYFSNTTFLKTVKLEKKTKNKLKHLIILILRLLAIASLVLAFCQPYIKDDNIGLTSGKTSISIYLDNSLSMNNLRQDNTLFEEAKKIAEATIRNYNEHDEFQLITNDFLTKHQRFYNREEIINLLNDLKLSPFHRTVPNIIERQKSILFNSNSSNKLSYLISDFQKSTSEVSKCKADTSILTFIVPVIASQYDNLFIDSAWFESPIIKYNQPMNLQVMVKNKSDRAVEDATINLLMNSKQKGIANFSVSSNQTTIIDIPFTISQSGWNKCILKIEDYPLTFDDEYFFRFFVTDKINLLCINGNNTNPFIKALFNTDDYFEYDEYNLGQIDHSTFDRYQLIVLNEIDRLSSGLISELKEYVTNGGNLILIPSSNSSIELEDYNNFLRGFSAKLFGNVAQQVSEVSYINFEHTLLQDIFEDIPRNMNFPQVKRYFTKTDSAHTLERKILSLDNGNDILTLLPYNKGNLFTYSIPMNTEWSNFPKHAIFVPIMYKIALYIKNNMSLSYNIGKDKSIKLSTKYINPNESFEFSTIEKSFIPDFRIAYGNIDFFIDEEFNQAGFYDIKIEPGNYKNNNLIPTTAFNYDRTESDLVSNSIMELEELTKEIGFHLIKAKSRDLSNVIKTINSGKPLWKLFLFIALGLLLTEILLIRFWKG